MRDNIDTHIALPWALLAVVLGVFLAVALSGCGSLNAGVGAAINHLDSDAAGALQNQKAIDDRALKAWQTAAGGITLGALGRNDTGNPDVVRAALMAAGVNNLGVVAITNGQVVVSTGMTAPYSPPPAPAPTPAQVAAAPASSAAAAAPLSVAPSLMTSPAILTPSVLNAAPLGSILTIPAAKASQ